MKKALVMAMSIITLSGLFGSSVSAHELHTFQNVAIYYTAQGGYLVDEDGERFDVDFDIPDNTLVLVTYDNKNTVTRFDDVPIKVEIIKE